MAENPATLKKRSVNIAGHATSVSMENIFWDRLNEIADAQNVSVSAIIKKIDAERSGNLSSALRVYILENS